MRMNPNRVRALGLASALGLLTVPGLGEGPGDEHRTMLVVRYDASAIRLTDGLVQALEQDLTTALLGNEQAPIQLTQIIGGHSDRQPDGVYIAEFRFRSDEVPPKPAATLVSQAVAKLLAARIGGSAKTDEDTFVERARAELEARSQTLDTLRMELAIADRVQSPEDVLRDLEQQLSVLRVEQSADEASLNSLTQRLDLSMRELDVAADEVETQREQLRRLQNISNRSEEIAKLEATLRKKQDLREFLTASLNALTSERAAAGTKLEAREARMNRLQIELAERAKRIDEAKVKEATLRSKLANAENALAATQARLDQMLSQQQRTSVEVSIWSVSKSRSKD